MTYSQAYDLIIQAYFNNEIKPLDVCFCFCGTLCDNDYKWARDSSFGVHNDYMNYKGVEYWEMERALLHGIWDYDRSQFISGDNVDHPLYEAALFNGMSAALEVLKEIHRSRGEDVDAITVPFTKRQLA